LSPGMPAGKSFSVNPPFPGKLTLPGEPSAFAPRATPDKSADNLVFAQQLIFM
jgi:hypothetical protein